MSVYTNKDNFISEFGEIDMKNSSLKECIKEVLKYEFNTGYYGLRNSEYTEDIIEFESARLSKNRRELDETKAYTLIKSGRNSKILSFNTIVEAVSSVSELFGEVYIITGRDIMIPISYGESLKLEKIN